MFRHYVLSSDVLTCALLMPASLVLWPSGWAEVRARGSSLQGKFGRSADNSHQAKVLWPSGCRTARVRACSPCGLHLFACLMLYYTIMIIIILMLVLVLLVVVRPVHLLRVWISEGLTQADS